MVWSSKRGESLGSARLKCSGALEISILELIGRALLLCEDSSKASLLYKAGQERGGSCFGSTPCQSGDALRASAVRATTMFIVQACLLSVVANSLPVFREGLCRRSFSRRLTASKKGLTAFFAFHSDSVSVVR